MLDWLPKHFLRPSIIPLSEYSRAISATASPILFLTEFDFSKPNASMSFCRITYASCFGMARNNSIELFSSVLRDLDAIRRKMTAAKDRVYNMIQIRDAERQVRYWGPEIKLTVASLEPYMCSTKPINNISGLVATQLLFKCSSACARTLLSVDCRADSSCASSACASAGRTDMVMRCGWEDSKGLKGYEGSECWILRSYALGARRIQCALIPTKSRVEDNYCTEWQKRWTRERFAGRGRKVSLSLFGKLTLDKVVLLWWGV